MIQATAFLPSRVCLEDIRSVGRPNLILVEFEARDDSAPGRFGAEAPSAGVFPARDPVWSMLNAGLPLAGPRRRLFPCTPMIIKEAEGSRRRAPGTTDADVARAMCHRPTCPSRRPTNLSVLFPATAECYLGAGQ